MHENGLINDREETRGSDWISPVDEGWGHFRGTDSYTRPLKTKGSWTFAHHTLSCNNPMDQTRKKIPSLAVMAAEQVAAHISEERHFQASTYSCENDLCHRN